MGTKFYVGALSNIGVLLWCTAASVSIFTSHALRRSARNEDLRRFLLWFGVLSAVLMLDDLFLLHEGFFPKYLHLPQPLVLALYGLLALGVLVRFGRSILSTDYRLLALALVFLGLSVLIDLMPPIQSVYRPLLEDGLKLAGIVLWSAYIVRTCLVVLSSRIGATL
jgi:hypothetical protein